MNSEVRIPQGDEKIMVELTVKEAMALGEGVLFHQHRSLKAQARKKIRRELARKLFPGSFAPGQAALDRENLI